MLAATALWAQQTFRGISLSEALVTLDQTSRQYDISFVYDELEDFTVSKTIPKGCSLPDAVRMVCGFYPVRIVEQGREIFVECMQKARTKLRGRIVDNENQPVPYANIALFSMTDSLLIGGGVSNEAGDFVIPCSAEQARVRISCVGFRTINRPMNIGQVGTIRMQMESYYIDQVTIRGAVPIIRYQDDRLEYLVSNDAFAKGQNGLELMDRVPMVSVIDGLISILGRGRAGLMINGRVVENDGESIRQKLWAMQAENIERIEVVTMPTGRQRMEGGGYVNIVMNHDQMLGWRGDFSGTIEPDEDKNWQLGGTVNYATKRFDASWNVYGNYMTEGVSQMTTYQRPLEFEKYSNMLDERKDKEVSTGLTLHYQPTAGWETGAMISYREGKSESALTDDGRMHFGINYAPFAGLGPDIKEYTTNSVSMLSPMGKMHTVSLTAYSDWQLTPLTSSISPLTSKFPTASLTYNYYSKWGKRGSAMDGRADIPIYEDASDDPYHLLNAFVLDTDYRIHSLKLDFSLPFSWAHIETGVGYTDIDNTVNKIQETEGQKVPDYNAYSYQERNTTAYLSMMKQVLPQFSFMASLNWEYSWLRGKEEDLTRRLKTRQTLGRLLPSLTLNYQLSTVNCQLTMGRTIDRPVFDELNRVPIYTTMTSLVSGNPALSPGLTDYIGLSLRHPNGLYANIWYRHGKDQTEWVTRFQIDNFQRYMVEYQSTRPENWLNEYQSGLFLRYQRHFGSLLNAVAEGTLYYYHGRSVAPDLDRNENDLFNPNKPELHGWGKTVALSADIFLNRQHTLVLNARYDHWFRQLEKMTVIDGFGYPTMTLRYSLLNERLNLSLDVCDPFHQHITDATRIYNWFTERVHTRHDSHTISLTATWSLGSQVRRTYRDKKDTETQRAEPRKELKIEN